MNHEWVGLLQRSIEALDGDRSTELQSRRKAHRAENAPPGVDAASHRPPPALLRHGTVMGIVWALDDHPQLWRESAVALTNSLRGGGVSRFTPWAVVDAVVKHTQLSGLRSALAESLPDVAAVVLPQVLIAATQQQGAASDGDAQSHALSVLELVRSWQTNPVLRQVLVSRRDDLLFATDSGAMSSRPKSTPSALAGFAPPAATGLASVKEGDSGFVSTSLAAADVADRQAKRAAIEKVLKSLGNIAGLTTSGSPTSGAPAPMSNSRAITAAIESMRRAAETNHACRICGAYFDDVQAQSNHSRLHFIGRGDESKGFVRLEPLTAGDMIQYDCNHADGSYLPVVGQPTGGAGKRRDRLQRVAIAPVT